ncbi:hypothetical protein MKEN_00920000 [Mycena kentingensis (nom. inval.)]|nr:hypothetical protein MKEN_00920000 [Mycena kentingensis (nom. inval.)]
MSRIALSLLVLFLCLVQLIAAAPVDANVTSVVEDLEKRVTHTGRGTWYYVDQNRGNCGYMDVNSSPVVAISKKRYDANNGDNCNQWVQITNLANGKVAYGKTRDSCESCNTESIDMSPSLFSKIAKQSTGQIQVSWHFMAKGWKP